MSMWTPAQHKAFANALATCAEWDEKIRVLEQIAKHSPAIAQQVEELRTLHDSNKQIAEAALAVEATTPKKSRGK